MAYVIDPPASPPVTQPADEGSELWEVLYEAMGFHRETDEATGFQLLLLCQVLMARVQEPYDLMRERPGMAGGAIMLDPDNAPEKNLLYLSQYVGAKLSANMDEAQRRAEIKSPSTWRRGQVGAIKLIAQRELTGTKWVRIKPRTPGPGEIYIRTLLSETPNPDRVELELLEDGIPAWNVLDYEAISGITVADVAAGWLTVEDVAKSDFPTVEALAHALPEELPE